MKKVFCVLFAILLIILLVWPMEMPETGEPAASAVAQVSKDIYAKEIIRSLKEEIRMLYGDIHSMEETILGQEYQLSLFVDPPEYFAAEPIIYDIPLDEDLQRYTYIMCVEYGIGDYYDLALAVMWQESEFVVDVISKTNDYGLMQINKCNHGWVSDKLGTTDFLDAEQNIEAGVYILSNLLHKYSSDHKALTAYNMGEGGAKIYWDAGHTSSVYSNAVMSKLNQLKSKK